MNVYIRLPLVIYKKVDSTDVIFHRKSNYIAATFAKFGTTQSNTPFENYVKVQKSVLEIFFTKAQSEQNALWRGRKLYLDKKFTSKFQLRNKKIEHNSQLIFFFSRYSDGTEPIFDKNISNVAAWAAIICSIFGCIGNLLTIIVLLRKKDLRNHSTTPFLLSLAFSDFCFSSFNLPLTAARFFEQDWPFR